MARIPTYQGRVGLDTSALSGASLEAGKSRADASLFQAQAEAAESLFRAAGTVVSKLSQEEERQEKNDARLWLYENASKFEVASEEHKANLEIEQDADDYASDADTQNLGPLSFRNQRLSWFTNEQNAKHPSGKAIYNPPNKYAQQMWSEYLAKQRGSIELDSIQVEAELRVQARYNQAERILDGWTAEVAEDHTKLNSKLTALQQFIDENALDAEEAEKSGSRVFLDSVTLQKLAKEKKQEMLVAHLEDRLFDNPYDVYLHLEGKGPYKKPFGTEKGLDANHIIEYKQKAIRKLSETTSEHIATIDRNAKAYLANIAAGGDGGNYKQAFANGAAESTYRTGYAGPLGSEKSKLFPGLEKKSKVALQNFYSQERVAMTAAALVKEFESKISHDEINATLMLIDDSVKNTDIRDNIIKALQIHQNGKPAKLDSAEMQAAILKAQAKIASIVELREKDPVQHAINSDDGKGGFGRMYYNKEINDKEKFERLETHYDRVNQPKNKRPLLTVPQAEAKLDAISRTTTGDDLIGQIKILKDQYEEYYPRVWKQLSEMENGLDANHAFIAAISSPVFLSDFATAVKTDKTKLKEFFPTSSSDPEIPTYSQIANESIKSFKPYIEAFHGNLPHRMDEVSPLADTFEKMVALKLRSGVTLTKAVDHVKKLLDSAVTLVGPKGQIKSERSNFYITKDLTQEDGTPLNAKKISDNVEDFFDDKEINFWFDSNPTVVIPKGSLAIINETMGRETYIESVKSNGMFVMNDTGDGVYLVVPMGDEGSFQPVEIVVPGEKEPVPVSFSFEDLMTPFEAP